MAFTGQLPRTWKLTQGDPLAQYAPPTPSISSCSTLDLSSLLWKMEALPCSVFGQDPAGRQEGEKGHPTKSLAEVLEGEADGLTRRGHPRGTRIRRNPQLGEDLA